MALEAENTVATTAVQIVAIAVVQPAAQIAEMCVEVAVKEEEVEVTLVREMPNTFSDSI